MLITFVNANDESFSIQDNYILSKNWSGFSEIPIDHQLSKAPYQDGKTYIDTLFDPRILTVEFLIKGDNRQEVFDRRLTVTKQFNPKLGVGKIIWEQEDGTTYHLDCIPYTPIFPDGQAQNKWYQVVIVQFLAPDPFWYDPTQIQQIMVGFSGGFSLPFSFPINFGTVGTQIDVSNSGNVSTPVIIYLYGEVVDPVITNTTTGEAITISQTVSDGDILIINTAFGEKSSLLLSGGVYTNAFEYIDPDSTFWKLEPGSNTISYSVTSEGANAACRVYYFHRYSGV